MKGKPQIRCATMGDPAHPMFSEEDSDLRLFKWVIGIRGYPSRAARDSVSKKMIAILPHRVVMSRVIGRQLSSSELVDHINFNILDCRRENLRVFNRFQNSQHRRTSNPAGFRGVTLHKRIQRWQSRVKHKGKCYYCGYYDSAEEAGRAAARKREELGFANEFTPSLVPPATGPARLEVLKSLPDELVKAAKGVDCGN